MVLAPIVISIFMVQAVLEPSGLALAIGAAMTYLSFFSPSYSPSKKKLIAMKV